jgi:Domain of unknown function (DUF4159)
MRPVALILAACLLCASGLLAQRFRFRGGGEGWLPEDAPLRTARDAPSHSTETPRWTNAPGLEKDVFTFVRIRYHRNPYGPRRAGYCFTDFPDSDLNLSWRLQQLTSLKVDPDARVLSLTDPHLFDYPFIYMVEPGALELNDSEVAALRHYLLNGGVLMADDFWGPKEWANFEQQIKRVLPERSFKELPMSHPIFHCVFDLGTDKNALQTPNYIAGERSQSTGVTWEYHDGVECKEVHVRAIEDDKRQIMVIACHNTDNGDGWEREGEYRYFFHEFSEKRAYPLAVNIVYYLMTH